MRVLLCVRGDYKRSIAGDSMYVSMLKKFGKYDDIEVSVNDGNLCDFSPYDVIHLFNLTSIGETYKYFKLAKMYNKKIIISPMYWNLEKYYEFIQDEENLKLWKRIECYRKEILKRCDLVLCSSEIEKDIIQNEYGKNIRCKMVHTGFYNENDEVPLFNFRERYKIDEFILSVGNITRRKNQLALAHACNELGIQLVLIGKGEKAYIKECIKYENVLYLGDMNSYFIYNAYKFAKVHALTGFGEIPGLSSISAAAYGCNIVCTTEGSPKEYFKDLALYASPFDSKEIKDNLYKAFKTPKNDKLKKYMAENYSWEKAINEIKDLYLTL